MTPAPDSDEALLRYYAARAREYERIYERPERQADLRSLEAAVSRSFAGREVIEIACGTGYWTRFIAAAARRVLALDANPETLDVARAKRLPANVDFGVADAYALAPSLGRFDAAFAGFWWSHVPLDAQQTFLVSLCERLEPGAVVVMLDNRFVQGNSTPISRRDALGNTYQRRSLEDGSVHEVLKNFPDAAELRAAFGALFDQVEILELPYYWLVACRGLARA